MACEYENYRSELSAAMQEAYSNTNDLDALCQTYSSIPSNIVSVQDKRSILDQSLRDFLHKLIKKHHADVEKLETFVTFTIETSRKELCTPTLPVAFLGDIFDASTLEQSEKLFTYVEKSVNIWKEELFFLSCKNHMLRMCNDLLRRLSRSQNTFFCGRILLFLAKFFPFSERSGLNIVSEFNLENSTKYGGEEEVADLKEFVETAGETEANGKSSIDYNLYCKFWALQDFFRNPNQCFTKVDWRTFSSHTGHVLAAFSSYKLEDQGSASVPSAPTTQNYFAKFLTNQKLLELQLSDSNFRRYILVQFLVTFQYLASPVKFKSDGQELRTEQKEWINTTTDTVYRLLSETPPDAAEFVRSVRHILSREEHWNDWKNKGCPSFKPPAFLAEEDEAPTTRKAMLRPRRTKKRLGDFMRDAEAQGRTFMGHSELTRLWNQPSNLEACKSKDRDFLPSLESYFEEAIQQTDPSLGVEDKYKRVNDGNFGWRALRLLARRSPHFFTHSNNPINKLPEYLETMIRKIAKDRPETVKMEVVTQPAEEEEEEDLLKPEKEENIEEESDRPAVKQPPAISSELVQQVASLVAPAWRKLAPKLGYAQDQIDFFHEGANEDADRARTMLDNWFAEDDDSSPENLAYTLEGLGLLAAAAVLKPLET